ncbi:MAG: hypothetical protein ACJAYU_001533 [Bradymonadia bacterium]|jgi:hypothetical protein
MRTYIVTLVLAVITVFLTVVLWGAVGQRLNGFIVSVVITVLLLVGAFGLAAWKGRWAGYRGASLRGWWAMIVAALIMLIVPPLLNKGVVAEGLGGHGTWWLGSNADSAPGFLGNGVQGIAQLLGYGEPAAETSANTLVAEPTAPVEESDTTSVDGSHVVVAEPEVVAPATVVEPASPTATEGQIEPQIAPVPAANEPVVPPAVVEQVAPSPAIEPPAQQPPAEPFPAPVSEGVAPPVSAQGQPPINAAPPAEQALPPTTPPRPTPAEIAATIAASQPIAHTVVVLPPSPILATPILAPSIERAPSPTLAVASPNPVNVGAPLVPQVEAVVVSGNTVWPSSAELHSWATSLAPMSFRDVQVAICALSGVDRLRVAHDWIALNITPLSGGPQAASVPTPEQRAAWASGAFASREAGSAGFAALFAELTCDAGAVVVAGGEAGYHRGEGTAAYWNAVQLDGDWLIVDSFQAAGCAPGPECGTPYSSAFFLAPPRATVRTRIPMQASFAAYGGDVDITALLSGPALGPEFFAAGLALQSVNSSQHFEITVANPSDYNVRVALWDSSAAMSVTCRSADVGGQTSFICPSPGPAGGRARLLGQARDGWAWVELAAWETP